MKKLSNAVIEYYIKNWRMNFVVATGNMFCTTENYFNINDLAFNFSLLIHFW